MASQNTPKLKPAQDAADKFKRELSKLTVAERKALLIDQGVLRNTIEVLGPDSRAQVITELGTTIAGSAEGPVAIDPSVSPPTDPTQDDPDPAQALADETHKAREHYLETHTLLSAAHIHKMVGSRSANPSGPAGDWKRHGKVFAIQVRGVDQFPDFQFGPGGEPWPDLKKVLAQLPPRCNSGWGAAFWFANPNVYADNKKPEDCLATDPDLVLKAAKNAHVDVIG